MKEKLIRLQKGAKKLWKRFSNYNNSKKRFALYLIILTLVLLLPPIVRITGLSEIASSSYSLLFSGYYIRSLIVILISLLFLLGWNLSIGFKGFVVHLFSLREDEPLVDFAFLWVITSVFMGIVDTVGVAGVVSERISLTGRALISQLLLLGGLIRSFISLWFSAKKTNRKTKILNIVEEAPQRSESQKGKKQVNRLFDDLDSEG
ncbi:MAG: hypothetical protein PHU61_02415 [Candidatus Absconditabacteria bacterium]|nr:hypothetical protein [Candidatus Absconditabacteria bacterium]MDD3868172.1 hypothetical protein [Candidatus Absconditabacteria bacterium]MDD4714559.1 hypothetical protein [Candidatus Absconditabacteria bacterium]